MNMSGSMGQRFQATTVGLGAAGFLHRSFHRIRDLRNCTAILSSFTAPSGRITRLRVCRAANRQPFIDGNISLLSA